jgi:hypothetical protein
MPDKKKKTAATKEPQEANATPQGITPSVPIGGWTDMRMPSWMDSITPYDHEINEQLKGHWGIAQEREPEDIFVKKDFIVDTITVNGNTVKEAMPELRRQYLSALTDSVKECQRLRAEHEKNTGRPVRNVTLNADSLINHIAIHTVAPEDPDKVVAMMGEALELAGRDFAQQKELPSINHTATKQHNKLTALRQALDKQMHPPKDISLFAQNAASTPDIFRHFKKADNNAEMYPDPLAFLNFGVVNEVSNTNKQ